MSPAALVTESRARLGMTLAEFGALVGKSASTVYAWELRARFAPELPPPSVRRVPPPSLAVCEAVLAACRVRVGELNGLEGVDVG